MPILLKVTNAITKGFLIGASDHFKGFPKGAVAKQFTAAFKKRSPCH
jgi:hypothetical protein